MPGQGRHPLRSDIREGIAFFTDHFHGFRDGEGASAYMTKQNCPLVFHFLNTENRIIPLTSAYNHGSVQPVNKETAGTTHSESGQYRSLQILDELSNNDALTQRDLSQRLGIALGLVNSYIKNLVAKGFITVSNIPPKRYAYYLTPKGFAEKSRLAYDLLSDYTRIYREAKNNYRRLFQELERAGRKRIVFAGADEVAEIAYITLQETGLEIAAVVDNDKAGERFFGNDVLPVIALTDIAYDTIVVTSYVRRERIVQELSDTGMDAKIVRMIFERRA
jgi:DNA-binding MarR family transcriptional regulator